MAAERTKPPRKRQPHPRAQSQARVPNSHELSRSPAPSHELREFSGRPTRGNSRIEGTRPVRSGLPPPPSSPANLYREETRAGFPYGFRGFCRSRCNTRRARRAKRPALSVPVSSPDFRGERLCRRLPSGCSVYATVGHRWPFGRRVCSADAPVMRRYHDTQRALGRRPPPLDG